MDTETIRIYDNSVEQYVNLTLHSTQLEAREAFAKELAVGSHILDLGAGPGIDAAAFMELGHIVTAYDPSEAFIAEARKRGVNAFLKSFDDLVEENAYDGVWASFSLLHARREDFSRHLDQIKTALKPDGILQLCMKLGSGEKRDDLGRFYCYYSQEELADYLVSAGFSIAAELVATGKGLAGKPDQFILIRANA